MAFIDWQVADRRLKQQEIQSLRKAANNRKQRSKKTIGLKIINAETYAAYCEEVAKKMANKQGKKKGSKKSLQINSNRRQKTAQSLTLSDSDYDELEEGIELPIEERDEAVDEVVDDDNRIKVQLSGELQATVEPNRPARTRRLPIRYRDE